MVGYQSLGGAAESGNNACCFAAETFCFWRVDNTDFATGVYDPFGGSGTTLAACEAYGQPSYIMELTPAFTDVIVKRYIRITGKTTVRCVRQGRELPREEIAAIFEPDEEGGEQE